MRMASMVTASLLTIVLTGCASPPAREFGRTEIDSINRLVQDFIAVYNAKNALKVAALFTGNGTVMPPNASAVQGTENVREYYVNRFAKGASGLQLELRDVAGSGSLAYATGGYRLTMAPPGGPERPDRGKFIFILRGTGEKWLLEYLMFSSDFAATP